MKIYCSLPHEIEFCNCNKRNVFEDNISKLKQKLILFHKVVGGEGMGVWRNVYQLNCHIFEKHILISVLLKYVKMYT